LNYLLLYRFALFSFGSFFKIIITLVFWKTAALHALNILLVKAGERKWRIEPFKMGVN